MTLRRAGRELRSRASSNPIRAGVQRLAVSVSELQWLLNSPLEEERRQRAAELLDQPAKRFDDARAVMTTLGGNIAAIRETANGMLHGALRGATLPAADPVTGVLPAGAADACLRLALEQLFARFVAYDVVLLPLVYGTDSGEAAQVDIVRVSPEDAPTLVPERDERDGSRRVYKLAGTRFGNFGAFFERRWRASDMLVGPPRRRGAHRARHAGAARPWRGGGAGAPRAAGAGRHRVRGDAGAGRRGRAPVAHAVRDAHDEQQGRARPARGHDGPAAAVHPRDRTGDRREAVARPPAVRVPGAFREDTGLAPDLGAPLFARATQIFGRLLDGTGDRYGPLSAKAGAWLLWIGRVAWGLIEIALPRTWGALLARYWLNLFYLLGVVGIASGMLFAWGSMRSLGVRLLLVAVGVDLARSLVRALLARRLPILRLVATVAVAIFLFGLATLLLKVPTIEHWADRQFTTVMDWLAPGWTGRGASGRGSARSAERLTRARRESIAPGPAGPRPPNPKVQSLPGGPGISAAVRSTATPGPCTSWPPRGGTHHEDTPAHHRGTFDKEYNELTGTLFFRDTHVREMLRLGRCQLDLDVRLLMMIDSLEMTDADRELILESCLDAREERVVITHGTDTMAETARFLGERLRNQTVVLTGAMVPYTFGSSDGLFNLGSALAFAQTLPHGIYVAMNGRYFDWHDVRKNKATGVFEERGPVGAARSLRSGAGRGTAAPLSARDASRCGDLRTGRVADPTPGTRPYEPKLEARATGPAHRGRLARGWHRAAAARTRAT